MEMYTILCCQISHALEIVNCASLCGPTDSNHSSNEGPIFHGFHNLRFHHVQIHLIVAVDWYLHEALNTHAKKVGSLIQRVVHESRSNDDHVIIPMVPESAGEAFTLDTSKCAVHSGPQLVVTCNPQRRCVCKGASGGEEAQHASWILNVVCIEPITKVVD